MKGTELDIGGKKELLNQFFVFLVHNHQKIFIMNIQFWYTMHYSCKKKYLLQLTKHPLKKFSSCIYFSSQKSAAVLFLKISNVTTFSNRWQLSLRNMFKTLSTARLFSHLSIALENVIVYSFNSNMFKFKVNAKIHVSLQFLNASTLSE